MFYHYKYFLDILFSKTELSYSNYYKSIIVIIILTLTLLKLAKVIVLLLYLY